MNEHEQLAFAMDHLRGVCGACRHYYGNDQTYCIKCPEKPGFGNWEWVYTEDGKPAPEVEFEPVVKSYWELDDRFDYNIVCSNCHSIFPVHPDTRYYNRCPKCGALASDEKLPDNYWNTHVLETYFV